MSYARGAEPTMLPKDPPIDRLYWVRQGKTARQCGYARDHAFKLCIGLDKFNAWTDGWDSMDRQLLNESGAQRRARAISRVERKHALALKTEVSNLVSTYLAASKGV